MRTDASMSLRRAERAADWAAQLADGPVTPARQAAFEAWLNEDPVNGETLEEIIGAWRAVEHYATAEPMMALREQALASARRSAQSRARQSPFRWLPWRAVAAAAAAIAAVVIGATGWTLAQPVTYATGLDERRVVALADGSHLSLDADSEVQVRYTSNERRLWLKRGRAQFEVAKNPLRPFSVQASNDVVVATGTAFSVELVDKQVRVVLYEGHVALLQRDPDGPKPILTTQGAHAERLLVPGREIILSADAVHVSTDGRPTQPLRSSVAGVASTDPVRSLAWKEGQLAFQDEPLSVVAERMNRYTDTPLRVTDPETAGTRISGVFRAGDTEALIEGLSANFTIQSRNDGRSIILFKRSRQP